MKAEGIAMKRKPAVHAAHHVGLASTYDMKKPSVKIFLVFCFVFLVLISLVCLLPPLWVLVSGFKEIKEFYAVPPTLLPASFDITKLTSTWGMLHFERYYINTLVMALGCIAFKVVFSGSAGYVFAMLRPRGVAVVETLLIVTMMIPANVKLATTYQNIVGLNMLNSYLPLWCMAATDTFMILVYKSFFQGIPISIVEAARIDGCGEVGSLFRIILPNSKPVLATSVILTINSAWSDFFWPYLIVKDKSLYTVMLQIYTIKSSTSIDVVMISLIFAIIPPVLLFLFFQKFIMEGFTMSGVKG